MKKIFTHINPDLDALGGVWLIKRFLPGWEEAEVGFSKASLSTDEQENAQPDVLYVDVGRGRLDHHQTGEYSSATDRCWQYIKEKRINQRFNKLEEKAIDELVKVVTEIDNARDLSWEEINQSRYYFYLHTITDGLRGSSATDGEVLDYGLKALDAVLLNLKNKIKAQEDLKKGKEFQTRWGKAIAVESSNKQVLLTGEVQGYVLVVKKDPATGAVRIYSRNDSGVDLTMAYNKFREKDPESDWFLHAGKKLLLNDSSVNPGMRPTKLKLGEIIEIIKE